MQTWIAPVTKICYYWCQVLSLCAMGVDRDISTLHLSDKYNALYLLIAIEYQESAHHRVSTHHRVSATSGFFLFKENPLYIW